jgi:hypothetical protein
MTGDSVKDTCRRGYSERVRPLPHLLLWSLGLRAAETQTTADERAALARHAQGRAPIVEIGVWHGVSTAVLRRAMRDGGVLWAVDPFPPGQLGFSLQKPKFSASGTAPSAGSGPRGCRPPPSTSAKSDSRWP